MEAALISRLEAVTARLESLASRPGGAPAAAASAAGDSLHPAVAAFDDFIAASIQPALTTGRALGNSDLSAQLDAVEAAYKAQRTFLLIATQSKKPSVLTLQKLLKPTTEALGKVEAGAVRGDFYNHMKGVADGLACLGWVGIEPAPVPFIKEATGSFLFYGNKVLREFKEKDPKHVEFINQFRDSINALADYVKQYHTTGVAWNANGKEAEQVAASASSAAPASAPAAPAPPAAPSAPAPPPAPAASAVEVVPPPTAALLSAIAAKGDGITSGLKKVTDDMKTHKNPGLRAGAVVPAKEAPEGAAPAKAAAAAPVHLPPKLELKEKVWWVENQRGNKEIIISDTNPKQSIFISNCFDSVIQVQGKVNQITIDKSDKTGLVFESVLASVEVINSKRMQVQCTGTFHTLTVDKVQEIQIYLSKEALGAKITSSVSSDMNVVLPPANEGDDFTEIPIPYQFQTTISNGKLITEPVRHE